MGRFTVSWKLLAHFDLMAATPLRKVETGAEKKYVVLRNSRRSILKLTKFTGNRSERWPSIKRRTEVRQSEKICQKMVKQIPKNVPQWKIRKIFKIPTSGVDNIIKKFKQSGEISVCEGQGGKSTVETTALKTDMTVWWKSLHGFRNTFTNHRPWTQITVPSTNVS